MGNVLDDDVSEGLLLAVNQARRETDGDGNPEIELRKRLLEYMCECAEEISSSKCKKTQYRILGANFNGRWPQCFKPGVFEKKIFQDIIGLNLSEIVKDIDNIEFPYLRRIAVRLMCNYYYPDYNFDYNLVN